MTNVVDFAKAKADRAKGGQVLHYAPSNTTYKVNGGCPHCRRCLLCEDTACNNPEYLSKCEEVGDVSHPWTDDLGAYSSHPNPCTAVPIIGSKGTE